MRSKYYILSPATQAVHMAVFANLVYPGQMDGPKYWLKLFRKAS